MRLPRLASLAALLVLGGGPAVAGPQPAALAVLRGDAPPSILRLERPVHVGSPLKMTPVVLQLDDGSREADVGFTAVAAFQFLWFNRFEAPAVPGHVFELEEIQVLFPPGPEVVPGAAVQLVAFRDPDGDPTNGAVLLTAFDDVIQVADGVTFSLYPVTPPVAVTGGTGDLYVGVVNRYVTSGVSPPSRPAALDTTASAGRSWFALWIGDPPDPPALPSDDVLATIDGVVAGNWLIRAAGTDNVLTNAVEVPALGLAALAALAALLALAGAFVLRR